MGKLTLVVGTFMCGSAVVRLAASATKPNRWPICQQQIPIEIQADDLRRALRFYEEIFGWKFSKAEGLPVEYWRIETNGPRGGLLQRPAKVPTRVASAIGLQRSRISPMPGVANPHRSVGGEGEGVYGRVGCGLRARSVCAGNERGAAAVSSRVDARRSAGH